MADYNGDSLGLDAYIVKRKLLSNSFTLDFMDGSGNIVITARKKIMSLDSKYEIKDAGGRILGRVEQHLQLALLPKVELQDSEGKMIGMLEFKGGIMQQLTQKSMQITDQNGAVAATISGDILNYNYSISSPDGKPAAQISRQMIGQNISSIIGNMFKDAYGISITPGSGVPSLMIIEFAVVVEHLAAAQQRSGGAIGLGAVAGAFGGQMPGGFSGGTGIRFGGKL
jgi:uncharacterized protein YxjI